MPADAPMDAAWSAMGFAAHPFAFTSRAADVLMAARALSRFGPLHERYCAIASEVLPPYPSEIAASHAASAFESTAGLAGVLVVEVEAPVPAPVGVAVDPPTEPPAAFAEDAGSAVVAPVGVVGGSDATTTAVGMFADDGKMSTSPSPPELLPRKAKIAPTIPSTPITPMIAMIGSELFEGLPAEVGGGGGAG